jgi:hypothetical protein
MCASVKQTRMSARLSRFEVSVRWPRLKVGECTQIGSGVHHGFWWPHAGRAALLGGGGGFGSGGRERNDRGVAVVRRVILGLQLRVVVRWLIECWS